MYENSFSRNIDNNYFIPQNYRNTYDARFVNAFPNSYYEDINYRQMPVYQMYPYNMEVNNL